ncbi:MAG: S8 family serine peptidase [Verrucomicrobia bacterium]|nr:S8 family serine peptidase [Verrucomicrobiota bacterium]
MYRYLRILISAWSALGVIGLAASTIHEHPRSSASNISTHTGALAPSTIQLPYTINGVITTNPSPPISKPDNTASLGLTPAAGDSPRIVTLSNLNTPALRESTTPLSQADTLSARNYRLRFFGRIQTATGRIHLFNPQTILLKFHSNRFASVLYTGKMRELECIRLLKQRNDVEFAEFDLLQERQYTPNDTQLSNQWHHETIGSYRAWDHAAGSHSVRIAIVDTPFQMDHPDLTANVTAGWDVVNDRAVTNAPGIEHSTMAAGLAAAVVNNGAGIAGAGNCRILPVNINGYTSEIYKGILWAASNDVRVVNISWSGVGSPILNNAATFLREHIQGILFMPGLNEIDNPNLENQPSIIAVSMTDAADNQRSAHGRHIDMAAPGWNILSTSTNSSYSTQSGTSFAAPLAAGIAGVLMSLNPETPADEIVQILNNSAEDFGAPGWDPYFGHGRIDFAAATKAMSRIQQITSTTGGVAVSFPWQSGFHYSLAYTDNLINPHWNTVPNTFSSTNNTTIILFDPAPPRSNRFYRVEITRP